MKVTSNFTSFHLCIRTSKVFDLLLLLDAKMYTITLLFTFIISLLGLASANPVVRKSLNPALIRVRSADVAFSVDSTDWPTNVVMLGGSQTYGMWVPTDGTWYDLGGITCLGIPAVATGACNDIVIDHIGVVAGNGPCSFVGLAGWSATLPGKSGDGYWTVGPPQNMMSAACGPV